MFLFTYATVEGEGGRGLSKMRTVAYRGTGCHTLCVRTHLLDLFSCFWQHFCLIVSSFICRNLILPLFKKDVFVTSGYFSLTRSISVVMKYAFFIILVIEVSQNTFNLNQTES